MTDNCSLERPMPPAQLAHSFRDGVAALPIEAYRHQLLSLKCKLSLQASLIKKRPLQMKSINFGLWSFKKQTSINVLQSSSYSKNELAQERIRVFTRLKYLSLIWLKPSLSALRPQMFDSWLVAWTVTWPSVSYVNIWDSC